ncbi:hypothetical protein [Persicitalea jodogahamensis]|uniref:Uncharacterized protein n=1 Tax=Persicitalea jodogahamensis TaxID=402147 RepID=A0A8J3D7I1_9BACT|nr:hypothetical protein [Persicitalea jodogahamensis]GHB62736.1 hypothetical protein GCM10007390_15710 [Persicitalea jodogahamensis]
MKKLFPILLTILVLAICQAKAQRAYQDKPFVQEYSVKYYLDAPDVELRKVRADRNGVIKILSSQGLMLPHGGQFLYPGSIVPDGRYRFIKDKKLSDLGAYQNQFVFLGDKAILSDAWAGSLYDEHGLTGAKHFAGGEDFAFLVSDGQKLVFLVDNKKVWQEDVSDILDIKYQPQKMQFWVLTKSGLHTFTPATLEWTEVLSGKNFTAFDIADNSRAVVGTSEGYQEWNPAAKKAVLKNKLPATDITAVKIIGNKSYFGTSQGAFAVNADGKIDYYYGERWLPGNEVVDIAEGPENSVLILTKSGLGELKFKFMTLYDKAMFYDKQVRMRHIRNGFNATVTRMDKGNLATGYLGDSDNDGLWTSMYLGGEIFRYKVTKDPEALQNCRESLDAMERLYTINPVAGFPSRSFERRGYIDQLSDPDRWQHSENPEWDWKATTSSDEAIGHIFAFGAMAELIDDPALKRRSIALIDTLMGHILDHDLYLIDYDGKPTQWGKWNPAYVNGFPTNIGDRKLNSSNITAMLQTAYHFTKKEKYKEKAMELLQKHGYLENLMRPMSEIGKATDESGALAQNLSDGWNHSDDEMYFVGYWGLYRYAFNDTLRAKYKEAILDHWQAERPEKEGAWNIFTALTGTPNFDLTEAVWYLQEYPLDMINWDVQNSHRQDIKLIDPNFRGQTTAEVLPPDERPIRRHNANTFQLDSKSKSNGSSENSAGDIWLLPYWMGRWLGVISPPMK